MAASADGRSSGKLRPCAETPADVLGVMSRLVGILASDALGIMPEERIRRVDPVFGEEER
jgi:hypothetical protein